MERKLFFSPIADEQLTYAQNNTPGAYRIFWHYGPDEVVARKKTAVIAIVALTPHP